MQVNSLLLKSNVASKWARKTPLEVPFILLLFVHKIRRLITRKCDAHKNLYDHILI